MPFCSIVDMCCPSKSRVWIYAKQFEFMDALDDFLISFKRSMIMLTPWFDYQFFDLITFRVSRRRREICIGHARLCVCLAVRRRMSTLLHGPGCNLGEWYGYLLVVQHWRICKAVHGFRYYDNTAGTQNVSECLYSLYAWFVYFHTVLQCPKIG